MGRRGAPKAGEAKSALAKTMLQKKVLRKNGASIAAQKGVDKYGKDGKKFNSAGALAGPAGDIESKSLKSVMEMASVDEFLVHAKLTKREFEARKGWFDDNADSTTVVARTPHTVTAVGGGGQQQQPQQDGGGAASSKGYEWHALPMPERPPWSHDDTPQALERREVESFVDWRRRLAATEERVMAAQEEEAARKGIALSGGMAGQAARMTPYEKNMEVWRQLWRVVERSDVLVQVVDARQPLFYYSQELHDYSRTHFRGITSRDAAAAAAAAAASGGASGGGVAAAAAAAAAVSSSAAHVERLMVLNKADFLTSSQRRLWSKELKARGLRFVWFSAKLQQEQLNADERKLRSGFDDGSDGYGGGGDKGGGAAGRALAEKEEQEAAAWEEHMSKAFDGGEAALTDDEEEEEDDEDSGDPDNDSDGGEDKEVSKGKQAQPLKAAAAAAAQEAGCDNDDADDDEDDDADKEEEEALSELSRVINREELLRVLEALSVEAAANRISPSFSSSSSSSSSSGAGGMGGSSGVKRAQVGIVGYPNVGKSSVINVLLGATPLNHSSLRVATGAQPGKTKHFQTLDLPPLPPPPPHHALPASVALSTAPAAKAVKAAAAAAAAETGKKTPLSSMTAKETTNNDAEDSDKVEKEEVELESVLMTLCDCPGLVFPQFVSSAAEMLLAGVLPVSQLRDHYPPMRLLCCRVPRALLELTYGFKAPKVGYDGLDSAGGERGDLLAAAAAARAGARATVASWAKGGNGRKRTAAAGGAGAGGGREDGEEGPTGAAALAAAQAEAAGLCDFLTVEAALVGVGRARSWFASGNRGEVDRSRVARLLLNDAQTGKLLVTLPPPALGFGSPSHASFVATTHKARLAELKKRKSTRQVMAAALGPGAAAGAGAGAEEEGAEALGGSGSGGAGSGQNGLTTAAAAAAAAAAGDKEAGGRADESLAALSKAYAAASLSSGRRGGADGGGDDDDDLWMDMELNAELEGDAGGKVTRLRATKNAKMDRRAHKEAAKKGGGGGSRKGRKAYGDDPYGTSGGGEGGGGSGGGGGGAGVHAAGRKANHGNSAPVGLRGVAVMPHHPSYSKGAGEEE